MISYQQYNRRKKANKSIEFRSGKKQENVSYGKQITKIQINNLEKTKQKLFRAVIMMYILFLRRIYGR